ncbi:MAG: sodium:calcium antiporter [Planctomycetes bacterium]|nr:sodium:calcium antiporter [Planctomycetota bacterium]
MQSIPINIIIIVACCGALWLGACWLVEAAARIAKWFGVSDLVIGLTVVAFGTSAPEFAATINASLQNLPDISVGNVVGSNIFNIGFILGGCAFVAVIKTKPEIFWRDGLLLLIITVILLVFAWDLHLSRLEGALLFLGLFVYLFYLFFKRQAVLDEDVPKEKATLKDGPLLLIGLALIVAGGYFLVGSAQFLAQKAGLSELVIGSTVVAACTSLPEFAISLVAILKKKYGISAGNLIGSNIFNTLGVLGIAATLRPLGFDSDVIHMLLMLIALTAFVIIFMRTGWRIIRTEGIILVLISLAMWIYIIITSLQNQSVTN